MNPVPWPTAVQVVLLEVVVVVTSIGACMGVDALRRPWMVLEILN
jgi:hypothetical protein